MKKQVKLNENDVRNIVQESVHQLMLEKGWNWRNWFKRNNDWDDEDDDWDDEEENDDDEVQPIGDDDDNNDSNYGMTDDEDEEQSSSNLFPDTPHVDGEFSYGGEPNSNTHIQLGGKDDDDSPEPIEMPQVPQFTQQPQQQQVPAQQQNDQAQDNSQQSQFPSQQQNGQGYNTNQQQQATQQPQQPAYRRGAKYHVAFSKENEDMFENHIKPTYNNLNGVIKSLTALRQIGEHNYNQASSIFGEWGQQNYNGGQPAFKAVCQQIDSIMPTLNNLKKEMKSVLMANGVRDSEDYQHYNMEEQALRRIVNNSINKVLLECIKK